LTNGCWGLGAGGWELGAGSWELGAGSWELGAGSFGVPRDSLVEGIINFAALVDGNANPKSTKFQIFF
jgi:hypothetical protein